MRNLHDIRAQRSGFRLNETLLRFRFDVAGKKNTPFAVNHLKHNRIVVASPRLTLSRNSRRIEHLDARVAATQGIAFIEKEKRNIALGKCLRKLCIVGITLRSTPDECGAHIEVARNGTQSFDVVGIGVRRKYVVNLRQPARP